MDNPTTNPMDTWLTTKEVAQRTGLSEFWWRNHRSKGTSPIPFYKLGDSQQSHVRYSLFQLMDWIESRQRQPTQPKETT